MAHQHLTPSIEKYQDYKNRSPNQKLSPISMVITTDPRPKQNIQQISPKSRAISILEPTKQNKKLIKQE
jgi:hypothetical protein